MMPVLIRFLPDTLSTDKNIKKAPKYIQGEKSRKKQGKFWKTGQQYNKQVRKRDGTRCPKGYAFYVGMTYPL